MLKLLPLLILAACSPPPKVDTTNYVKDWQSYCKKRPIVPECERWIWVPTNPTSTTGGKVDD